VSWTPAWRKEMPASNANPLIHMGLKYTPNAEGSQRLVRGVVLKLPEVWKEMPILEEPSDNSMRECPIANTTAA